MYNFRLRHSTGPLHSLCPIVLALLLCLPIPATAQYAAWEDLRQAFEAALEQAPVSDWESGSWDPGDIEECFEDQSFCFGNNPLTVYSYAEFRPRFPELRRYAGGFMLGEDEGVVVLLQTPPEMQYMGFTPYVHNRRLPDAPFWSTRRPLVTASFGDSLNQLRFNAHPGPGEVPGSAYPFERLSALVMTANQSVATGLVELLEASGLPASATNILSVPVGDATLPLYAGYSRDADEFALLGRFSLPADPQAVEDWYAASPVAVYRVALDTGGFTPYPLQPYASRITGRSEYELLPGVEARLANLATALRRRHAPSAPRTFATGTGYAGEGWDCLRDYLPCAYDNQDALYYRFNTFPTILNMTSDAGNFWYIAGVNHQRTGKALYTNHAVYFVQIAGGVSSIDDSDSIGSAAFYAQAFAGGLEIGDFDDFYVFRIARDCAIDELEAGFCIEVPYPSQGQPIGVEDDDDIYPVIRFYVDSQSGVGPALSEIVPPVLLVYE
ncbi:hypothetical protein E4634_00575 [Mangrovimicrobium sediminis]|uniref:Uncharacterized protein n=1 Tax=Mangrovimicrobium sediminis TaxID=2562682 RepID=A0A4Z0M987_9GAMM|nr:hypothetical protein [Haliea sp. SAOS-164]TGD76079.1 hypothetical protein E4634_00575 [Haliea sp. SAOS-164]